MNPVRQIEPVNAYEVYKREPRQEKKQGWLGIIIDMLLYIVTVALFGLICLLG